MKTRGREMTRALFGSNLTVVPGIQPGPSDSQVYKFIAFVIYIPIRMWFFSYIVKK